MHINIIFVVFLQTLTFYKNACLPTEVLPILTFQQLAQCYWISDDFFPFLQFLIQHMVITLMLGVIPLEKMFCISMLCLEPPWHPITLIPLLASVQS